MSMKITFLGAVHQVTGSRYLIEHENIKLLVDCGMFQGSHESVMRNEQPFPVDPRSIDVMVLTHAHIDHTGYIPALVKQGFKGSIYCSKGTFALCSLVLVDSGNVQESNAKHAHNNHSVGGPDHPPAVALYTAQDAQDSLPLFKPIEYDTQIMVGALKITLIRSGHILGSSFVVISDGKKTVTFSGDLGRPQQPIMKAPPAIKQTDFLVLESTYGDRLHKKSDTIKDLGDVIHATVTRGGVLIIPCFAVERTEEVLYCLHQLQQRNVLPDIPIFLDSPLAAGIADLFCDYQQEYKLSAQECKTMLHIATYTRTGEESKKIDTITHPAIIIAGSGMADGGRVLFHLDQFIQDSRNTVLFVGFQAKGTLGYYLTSGAKSIKIRGKQHEVRAHIQSLTTLSAHADYNEILQWLTHFERAPEKTFLTHGQLESSQALKIRIEKQFGWLVVIPEYAQSFDLS